MITAVGFSENEFSLSDPGRLCRGRERWIEPWPHDEPPDAVFRGVISGAAFEDDSARDALRGVQHSGITLVDVIHSLLGDSDVLAFMEDGHPADMPEAADHIEAYTGYRYGGSRTEALVRWTVSLKGNAVTELLGDDPTVDRVRGFAVPRADADEEVLRERLFLLTGMSTLDSPPARYQPAAIPEVLEQASLLVLLHRDKHGPAIGVYAEGHVDLADLLEPLALAAEALLVPFAIPPMLARWDRALSELKGRWDEAANGPFPVPEAPEGSAWEGRRRRRRRKEERKEEQAAKKATEITDLDLDAALLIEETAEVARPAPEQEDVLVTGEEDLDELVETPADEDPEDEAADDDFDDGVLTFGDEDDGVLEIGD